MFLTHDNVIAEFHVVKNNIIQGSPLKHTENLFHKPFDSEYLNTFLSDGELEAPKIDLYQQSTAKMFCMTYEFLCYIHFKLKIIKVNSIKIRLKYVEVKEIKKKFKI